jgi:hypothetical protein
MAPVRQVGAPTILEADFVERHRTPWEVSLFFAPRCPSSRSACGGARRTTRQLIAAPARAVAAGSGRRQTETPSFAGGAEETGWSTTVVCQDLRMSVSDRRCSPSSPPRRGFERVGDWLLRPYSGAAPKDMEGGSARGRAVRRSKKSIARPQGWPSIEQPRWNSEEGGLNPYGPPIDIRSSKSRRTAGEEPPSVATRSAELQ